MTMKNTRLKQAGFFDAGLSVLILALAGGAVYITESITDADIASTAEQQATTARVVVADPQNRGDSIIRQN